jgi:hypothetical protein
MLDLLRLLLGLMADLFRSRASLEAEVLALRQQINVLQRLRPKRPTLSSLDRLVLGWICRRFPNACDALAIIRSTQHVQSLDGRGFKKTPPTRSDDASHFYFVLPSAKVGCHPAPFWLGAAAMTLIFFFLGFLASRLLLCWPLAMSISLGLRLTLVEMNWPNS